MCIASFLSVIMFFFLIFKDYGLVIALLGTIATYAIILIIKFLYKLYEEKDINTRRKDY